MASKLVIRITHATDDVERSVIGLTVAATAVASGITTEVYLMNDGVALAQAGVAESMTLEHAPPVIELFKQVTAGARVFACTQCMMRRGLNVDDLRDGVQQAGAPVLLASVIEDGVKEMSF